jgi:predicted RNase H-like nuclease
VRYLGIDLAWGEGTAARPANRSGVVALGPDGEVLVAGWTVGLDETADWIAEHAGDDALLFVDAPLVVANASGQRLADKQTGQRYGRWGVSANSVNLASAHRAGVRLRERLEEVGWRYHDGLTGPPAAGRHLAECYPYTTIVGAPELGYAEHRPPYKRVRLPAAQAWPIRTAACDELLCRTASLRHADPPMDLRSHPETRRLLDEPSPPRPTAYKQREDLLDAALCAWTAALWHRHGDVRCQVLGAGDPATDGGRVPTMIAPARPEQRRD